MSRAFFEAVFNQNFENSDFKNNIAIIDKYHNKSLTYQELYNEVLSMKFSIDKKLNSNDINSLDGKGIVALNLSKNYQFIVAQLACSYLNLAFLPLDIKQKNRNLEILDMVKPILIINDHDILKMDTFNSIEHNCDYIIFSSGSTGNPKGITMKGYPAIHIVSQQAKFINIEPNDKYIWLLSPAFDASLSDIYSTLLGHATLVIPNFETFEIKKLCESIDSDNISFMDLPPSLFPLFYKTKNKYSLKSLKGIVFGGETAPENITQELSKQFNMFQAYGPTETTICSSMKKVSFDSLTTDIGNPLDGVTYKIVDNELLISGEVVSLGYLNNHKLNSDKFVTYNGITWFKTGDAVTYENDIYIYRGRLDRQFKFHSQLISPEEIETKALTNGASFAHIHFDGKIHMYYQGNLNLDNFKNSLNSYMIPHFLNEIEKSINVEDLLNSNHKFDHKLFLKNIKK